MKVPRGSVIFLNLVSQQGKRLFMKPVVEAVPNLTKLVIFVLRLFNPSVSVKHTSRPAGAPNVQIYSVCFALVVSLRGGVALRTKRRVLPGHDCVEG